MLVIGADLVSGLGASVGEAALKKVAFLAAASPLPNATTELASAVIPIGFWFEEAGTVLDIEKGPEKILPVRPPPSGALTVAHLTGRLAALISGATHSPPAFSEEILTRRARVEISALSMEEEPEEAADGDLRLVPEGGSVHFYLGGLTSRTRWPRSLEPAPVIRLSRKRMESLSLKAGDMASVEGNGTAVEVQVKAADNRPDDVAGIGGPLLKAKDLMKWRLIAEPAAIVAGPMRVKVKKGAS
jgi:hypothetical protein